VAKQAATYAMMVVAPFTLHAWIGRMVALSGSGVAGPAYAEAQRLHVVGSIAVVLGDRRSGGALRAQGLGQAPCRSLIRTSDPYSSFPRSIPRDTLRSVEHMLEQTNMCWTLNR
jgi:hypothetical protein